MTSDPARAVSGPAVTRRVYPSLFVSLAAVALTTLLVHFPVLSSQARSLDDQQYVQNNPLVRSPGWSNAGTFLAEIIRPSTVEGYYQPLAMISLMIDTAIGGSPENMGVYRRTNLLLHVVNVVLVGWLLHALFGDVLAASFGAALFGLHPITVEPVAWIAERKGLLAAFFTLWALVLYVRFVRRRSAPAYAGCLAAFALALLSKPTAVTLPLLVLVLNWWPLRRTLKTALKEAAPLFGLAALSATVTFLGQQQIESAVTPIAAPLAEAILKPLYALGLYLQKLAWPADMSGYYIAPAPLRLSDPHLLGKLATALLLLGAAALTLRRSRSVTAAGLFFLLAIAPTLGVVRFTNVVASDKFCYLPMVGLIMLAVAGLQAALQWVRRSPDARRVLPVTVVPLLVLLVCAVVTRLTLRNWQNTETLFAHQIRTSLCPWQPHAALASYLREQNRLAESLEHYAAAIRLNPLVWRERNNFALALAQAGRLDAALTQHEQALRLRPDNANLYFSMAGTLLSAGRTDQAISHYERALTLDPDYISARFNLAIALVAANRNADAMAEYRQLLQQSPAHYRARCNLALLLLQTGDVTAAVRECEQALATAPENPDVRTMLAGALAAAGQQAAALEQYQAVLAAHPQHQGARTGLSQMEAGSGRATTEPVGQRP